MSEQDFLSSLPPEVASLFDGLKPEQRRIVTTLDRPVFVAAGAGSGKTFTLTRRIVWALCPGSGEDGKPFLDSLDQALIITFTEKAAGEIKERIRSSLRDAGLAEEALKVDSAWVSTIHHMCGRILRAHALDLGLDPNFKMIGAQTASLLRAQACEKALADFAGDPGLDALYAEYRSGNDSAKEGVLGLVSQVSNKAASALEGLKSLEFVSAKEDVDGTMSALKLAYEALCACDSKYEDELERMRAELAAVEGYFELPPARRTAKAARDIVDGLKGPNGNKWRAKAVKEFSDEAKAALAQAKAGCAMACAQSLEQPLWRLVAHVEELYAEAKEKRGELDNDDLLQTLANAFREHPEIAAEYADKFRLVMVDEFQDTNAQQVSMVKGLSGPDACHLTTVGDAQQAIYGFRGADVSVFEEHGLSVGEDNTVRLDFNFRSDDAILRFVARTCGDTGIVPNFMDLHPKPGRESKFPDGVCPRVVVELTRAHKLGQKSVSKELRDRVAAAQLADRLAAIREAGVAPRQMAVLMRSLNQADIYIAALRERGLESVVVGGSTFSSAPEVRVVEALLHALASPQDTKTGLYPVLEGGMFELDADDLLLLATKPQDVLDAPAKRRIYPGVRPDAPDFGGVEPSERLKAARRVMGRAWDRVGKMPIADVCLMAVRESGWLARLERQGVQGRAVAANVLAAIRHVRELSDEFGLDAALVADEFSRWLEKVKEGPASLSGEGLDAVSFMTAHASKGLEFDVVAVVGCCGSEYTRQAPRLLSMRDGDRELLSLAPASLTLPDLGEDAPTCPEECKTPLEWRVLMDQKRVTDEEREDGRLFYVALTRAKECVVLCLSATEKKGGELSPKMTGAIAEGLFGERPLAGNGRFEYGGVADGLVRCVDLSRCEDGVSVDSGNTLPPCAATRACAKAGKGEDEVSSTDGGAAAGTDASAAAIAGDAADVAVSCAADAGCGAADAESGARGAFELFDINAQTDAPLSYWRPREDVFSYSSAHQMLRNQRLEGTAGAAQAGGAVSPVVAGQDAAVAELACAADAAARDDNASAAFGAAPANKPLELDDVLSLPVPLSAGADELARANEVPASEAPQAGRRRVPEPKPSTEDDGEPAHTDDVDRATSLGSAFHELARYMVETGSAPSTRRVELVAGAYGVGPRDRKRLSAALARWERSAIRAEARSRACLRAEVPFFCEVDSPLGHELEGAIDLLATDGAPCAVAVSDGDATLACGAGESGAFEGSARDSGAVSAGVPSALLVDYKTGDHGATYAQIRERHEMQARFYAYVLQRQGYGAVTCAFVCVELEDEHGEPVVCRYEFAPAEGAARS